MKKKMTIKQFMKALRAKVVAEKEAGILRSRQFRIEKWQGEEALPCYYCPIEYVAGVPQHEYYKGAVKLGLSAKDRDLIADAADFRISELQEKTKRNATVRKLRLELAEALDII
jgi:hypothetical protein